MPVVRKVRYHEHKNAGYGWQDGKDCDLVCILAIATRHSVGDAEEVLRRKGLYSAIRDDAIISFDNDNGSPANLRVLKNLAKRLGNVEMFEEPNPEQD